MSGERITPIRQADRQTNSKPEPGEWFRMAHNLTSALYSTPELDKTQIRLVLYVIHQTWGQKGRKSFIFTTAGAARALDIDKALVRRAKDSLVQANILVKEDRDGNEIAVNKYPEKWDLHILTGKRTAETERKKKYFERGDLCAPLEQGGPMRPPGGTYAPPKGDLCAPSSSLNPALSNNLSGPIDSRYNVDNSSSMRETSKFAPHLATLMTVANYPFDAATDETMLAKFEAMYPGIDLLQEINSWSVYKLGKPIAKKDNPRGQLNTWMRKASEPPKYGPPRKATSDAAKAELDAWFKGG